MLHTGSPRFSDVRAAAVARVEGANAAWSQVFNGVSTAGRAAALAGVTGDFAVGMPLADGSTLLAVDRFGIQSLCYRVDQGQLRFAARADALADANTPVDPQAIFDYLYFHVIPSPRTIYQGIFRLPPGHMAVFDQGHLTVQRYWTPVFEEPRSASFDSLKAEFQQLLVDAVAAQLGHGRPACFLSGGYRQLDRGRHGGAH